MKFLALFFLAMSLTLSFPLSYAEAGPKHKISQHHVKKQKIKAHQQEKRHKAYAESRHKRKSSSRSSKRHAIHPRKHQRVKPSLRSQNEQREEAWLEHAKEGQLKGKASWYGRDFHGGQTASGLNYDMYTFTAAHRTLPIGTVVKVTRQDSGKSVMVCVTDRGPFVRGRIIDLSYAAADQLGLRKKGVGDVNLEVVSDAKGSPLKAKQAFFVTYQAAKGPEKSGPFKEFADACAMQEALRQAHPDAKVVLE
ncbi:MAG: septal ring lytic transglycosylase RlpA family protein [Desulfovibrio sp.]|nr:septal ring lytic transglycosylase RlpA family protein [Desulfovibrio sp.]